MKVMYLDESGDHNLKRINPIFPVFVLGGVIVERAYARDVIAPAIRQFKLAHFGRDDVILHTVEITKGRGEYHFLADPVRRGEFFADLNAMLQELDFMVFACVIRKDKHLAKYGANAADPYEYSLEILVERFCKELGTELDNGFICAETRNPGADKALMESWNNLIVGRYGTGFTRSAQIDARVVGLDLKDKKLNIPGLQLADLVITPIGRHIAGMPSKPNEVQWSVVETKLRRVGGTYWGRGLIVRP